MKIEKKLSSNLIYILIILITIFTRINNIGIPLSYDEVVHGYIGKEIILKGKLPYVDAFDQKPFGVYIPHVISGVFDTGNQLSARIIGLTISVLVNIIGYAILSKHFGKLAGLIFVILELFIGDSKLIEGQYNLLTEQQLKLPLLLTYGWFALNTRKREWPNLIYGGLLICWLSMIKQTYILLSIPASITIFINTKSLTKLSLFYFSLLTPWFIFIVPYLYSPTSLSWFMLGIYSYNKKFYTGISFGKTQEIFEFLYTSKAIIYGLVIGLFSSLLVTFKKFKLNSNYQTFIIFFVSTIFIGIFSIYLGGDKLYLHYFLMLVFPIEMWIAISITTQNTNKPFIDKLSILSLSLLLIYTISKVNNPLVTMHKYNNQLSSEDNSKVEEWISKYPNIYLTGQTVSFYYDKKLPLIGNFIITDLPFLDDHDYFYDLFIIHHDLKLVVPKSIMDNRNRFKEYISKYYVCDQSPSVYLYCPN